MEWEMVIYRGCPRGQLNHAKVKGKMKEFEKVLVSFRATLNCSLFVTGSNSKLLSGELATLLVGRTSTTF